MPCAAKGANLENFRTEIARLSFDYLIISDSDTSSHPDFSDSAFIEEFGSGTMQRLLPSPSIAPAVLEIEPISFPAAIGPHRFYITAIQGDRRWEYPIQLSQIEAWWAFPKLAALDWTLNDAGIPIYAADIHAAFELLVGGFSA